MMAERLAEIRELCKGAPWGSLPLVAELLDHIAQLEAQADESSATMERLSGVVERYRGGMQPSSAERCTLRWSHSSATDRGSFDRGWEAREAEGLEARSEGEQGTTGERNDNGRDEGMKDEMKLPEEIQDLFTESASLKECRDACIRIWWGAGRAAKYAFKAEKACRKAWMLVGELYPQIVNKECTYFSLEGVVRFKENQ